MKRLKRTATIAPKKIFFFSAVKFNWLNTKVCFANLNKFGVKLILAKKFKKKDKKNSNISVCYHIT